MCLDLSLVMLCHTRTGMQTNNPYELLPTSEVKVFCIRHWRRTLEMMEIKVDEHKKKSVAPQPEIFLNGPLHTASSLNISQIDFGMKFAKAEFIAVQLSGSVYGDLLPPL